MVITIDVNSSWLCFFNNTQLEYKPHNSICYKLNKITVYVHCCRKYKCTHFLRATTYSLIKHVTFQWTQIPLAGLCFFIYACQGRDYVYIDLLENVELFLHEQTKILANAACSVGSQQFLS